MANVQRKYIGSTDESIVFQGTMNPLPIKTNTVYGSDLKRCKETAKLYFPNATYTPNPKFRELSFGDFEMKTYDELKHNELYCKWIDHPEAVTPPNGESFWQFQQRVFDCFDETVNTSGEYVFVLHGGVIRLLLSKFGPEQKSFQEIHVSHRTIYSLYWERLSHLKGGERCKQLSVEPITVNENM